MVVESDVDATQAFASISARQPDWLESTGVRGELTSEKIASLRASSPLTEYEFYILSNGRVLVFTPEEEKALSGALKALAPSEFRPAVHHSDLVAIMASQYGENGSMRLLDFGTLLIRRHGEIQVRSIRIIDGNRSGRFPVVSFLQSEYPELAPLSLCDINF